MRVQSLLFGAGWTEAKAKEWAKAHGYKYGKVDITDQYVRIRQFDPKGLKVKRTITLGRGIRAVVAREENMAAKKKKSAHRRRTSTAAKPATRRKRRRAVKESPGKRRRTSGLVMEAKRPRKRAKTKRRSSKRRVMRAWPGNTAGHRKAAKKGWRKRKSSRRRVSEMTEARPRRRAKSRRSRKHHTYEARPRRRRARRARETSVHEAKKHRRSSRRRGRSMYASRSGSRSGLSGTQFAVAIVAGGIGFVAADALDRFLATYNPDPTKADPKGPPKDKFTSDGAGTLANTLNLAATPNLYRIGAGIGMTALPAVASMFVKHPLVKSSLEGAAIGAGVKLFSLFWNNFLMGHLLKPKDTSTASLQKSYIARLYPAEVAAAINMEQKPPQQQVSSGGSGALSAAPQLPQAGVGDVGPFALQGSSEYPDAAQALRANAGLHGEFPTMQNVWGTGAYPTATQAMHPMHGRPGVGADPVAAAPVPTQVVVPAPQAYQPGPPAGPGPGPQAAPHKDEGCGCIGERNVYSAFLGYTEESASN